MENNFSAACIQMNSGNNIARNIATAEKLIRAAAKAGSNFIALPENAFLMRENRDELIKAAVKLEENPALIAMQKLAAELNIWLLLGSIAVKGESDKFYNRSVLIDASGKINTAYDKIHLFDVDVPGGETHRESDNFLAGNKEITANLPWIKLGLTICYDLRFPNQFKKLAQNGAGAITVPSAFTYKTGEAHWHSLLRARAIENSCYILAPAQCGFHPRNRQTYGHSLIIDPWGKILAEASEDKEEFIMAEIDMAKVNTIREKLPAWKNN